MVKAIVIPPAGPIQTIELNTTGRAAVNGSLDQLQQLVGGYIQAVPVPPFIKGGISATAYINEDGKADAECKPNMRATDFMVPGIGIMPGDYIAGTMVLVGFDAEVGEHLPDLPPGVTQRVRLIEREAG